MNDVEVPHSGPKSLAGRYGGSPHRKTVATLNDGEGSAHRTKGGSPRLGAAVRPLLKEGVGYEIDGDIVRVFRGRDALLLRGAKIAPLIARLLATLDGASTRAEVIEALPAPLMALGDRIVSALERMGTVVEGPERPIPEGIPPEVARLSQEYGEGWENRLTNWSTTHVRVDGPEALTERVREILEAQGVGRGSVTRRDTAETSEVLSVHIDSDAFAKRPEWTISVTLRVDGATVTRRAGQATTPVPCPAAATTPLASDLAIVLASFEVLDAVLLGRDTTAATRITTITNDSRMIRHEGLQQADLEDGRQKHDVPATARHAARSTTDATTARTYPIQTQGAREGHAGPGQEAIHCAAVAERRVDFDDDWSEDVRSLARLIVMYWGNVPLATVSDDGATALATTTALGEVATARAPAADEALRSSLRLLATRLQTTVVPGSARAARTGDAVRDFAILTSERRFENIGTMWGNIPEAEHEGHSADDTGRSHTPIQIARVHDLPPATATADLDQGGEGLMSFEKLAEIVRHTVLPTRLEVGYDLQPSVHRPLPSGGDKNAVKLLVECDLGHGRSVHEIDLHGRRLVETQIPANKWEDARNVTFHVEAHVVEMLHTYGEFGLCLLLIETGAMRAQVETLARTLGVAASRTGGAWVGTSRDRVLRTNIITLWMNAPPRNEGVTDKITPPKKRTARPKAPELDAMIDEMVRCGARAADRLALDARATIRKPFKWTGKRTSNGRIAAGRHGKRSEEVVADILRSIAVYEGGPHEVRVDAVMPHPQGTISKWAWGVDGLTHTPLRPREAAAANSALGGNASVLTIHARHGFASDGDAYAYVEAHMAAGEILQATGLAAARHGWYARGYRALPDAIVGAILALDRRPLLQIQIGPSADKLRYRLA